jgi:cytochrome c oxidase subunit I
VWPDKLTGDGFFDLAFWNLVATIGSYILAVGILMFIINVWRTTRKGAKAPLDPWDARTLEWLTSTPPEEYNFERTPTIHALDEYFHRKYEEVETDHGVRLHKVRDAEELLADEKANADKVIELPAPSYWPILWAFGLPIIGYGVIYSRILVVVGATIVLLGMFGWALEPSYADKSDYDPPSEDGPSKELATVG